jgi:signal transduction histidine kinase/CheY-like chemotaxis protein
MSLQRIASAPVITKTIAAVAWLLALVLAVFLAVEVNQLRLLSEAEATLAEGNTANVSQLQKEYFKLLLTIESSLHANQLIDREAIGFQNDLWLSRVDVLSKATGAESLRQTVVFTNFISSFNAFESTFEALLKKPRLSKTELESARRALEALGVQVNAVTLRAAQDVNEREEKARGVMRDQNRYLVGLMGLEFVLFFSAGAVLWQRSKASLRERNALRALAHRLEEANTKAELANRGKTHFLANMSHELRTPLNGMLGMLGLLEGTQPNAEQTDYIDTARRSARHLLALLNDVLDLSSMDAGKLSVKPATTYLTGVFGDVEALSRSLAHAKQLGLHFAMDPTVPPWAVLDDTRFKQVLLNLLSNAIKFSESGSIEVIASVQGAKAPQPGDTFVLDVVVRDQGVGMDAATCSRLFHRFEQGEAGTDRRFQGTGLGLEISRSLARLMGGDIVVQSQKGLGTQFTVSVLLQCAESPKPVFESTQALPPRIRKVDILVAEDNSTNRKYIGTLLTKMGHSVRFAEDGEQAVAQVNSLVPDVVLMDLHMPVMDGIEATKTLRSRDGAAAKVPIVALTADVWDQTKDIALGAGMNAFLTKPVDAIALEKLLVSLFPWSGNTTLAQSTISAIPTTAAAPATRRRFRAGDLTKHLNMANLGEACLVMGREGLTELVTDFGRTEAGNLAHIRKALTDGRTDLLRDVAHSVKGESAGLGLLSVSMVAQDIERNGAQFTPKQCTEARIALEEAWSAGSALLEQLGMLEPVVDAPEPLSAPVPVPLSTAVAADGLIQIIYSSTAIAPGAEQLTAIYESCLRHNHRHGITGILLIHDDRFMQLLEGPAPAVRERFAVIQADARHTDVWTVVDHNVAQRQVKDWSMAVCKVVSTETANTLCAPFFGDLQIDLKRMVSPGTALDILTAFSSATLGVH